MAEPTLAEQVNAARAAIDERAADALAAAYRTQLRAVLRDTLRKFRSVGLTAAADWSPPVLADVLSTTVDTRRIRQRQATAAGHVSGTYSSMVPGVEFGVTHPITQGLLDRLGERAEALGHGLRQPVADAIADGWARGLSVDQTAALIREKVGESIGWRAEMLARTDLNGLSNGGGQIAVQQLNEAAGKAGEKPPIQSKTWLSSRDGKVRDTHAEADGQTVPVDQSYSVGGEPLMYPGDPSGSAAEVMNCRCTELYGDVPAGPPEAAANLAAAETVLLIDGVSHPITSSIVREAAGFRSAPDVPLTASDEEALAMSATETDTDTTSDATGAAWVSDVAFEGVATGDGRFIVEGALSWRTPPLTLMSMIETPDFGGHAGAQVAGRMDTFERLTSGVRLDGMAIEKGAPVIRSSGVFDIGDRGSETERMVTDEIMRGVSVDLAIHAWAFRDPETGEIIETDDASEADWERAFMGELQMAITDAEIMAATVCPTPAFADAQIALLASASPAPVRLPKVWLNDDGTLMTSVYAPAVMVPFTAEFDGPSALVAAAVAPVTPPREWFFTPEADHAVPLTFTDDGRVYGHIAAWNSCHTGFLNGQWSQCVTPPRSQSQYAYFHVGELPTAEGDLVPIGKLMIGEAHAPITGGPATARSHYDRTGKVGAYVRAIDGAHGIWISGVLSERLDDTDRRDLHANPPSGDWRRIDGGMELIAALSVPVPGYPVTRSQMALVAGADGDLVVGALILSGGVEDEPVADETAAALDAAVSGPDALHDLIDPAV